MGKQKVPNTELFHNDYEYRNNSPKSYDNLPIYAQGPSTKGNGVGDGVKEYGQSSGGGGVGTMFSNWLTGSGSEVRTFSNDQMAGAMKDAWRVNQARDAFYAKYKDASSLKGAHLTNFKGSFGIEGIFRAGFDPVEQYVGSYTVSAWSDGNSLRFSVWNNTSFKSFFYGIGGDYFRSTLGPGGNMYQYYIWDEPLDMNRVK